MRKLGTEVKLHFAVVMLAQAGGQVLYGAVCFLAAGDAWETPFTWSRGPLYAGCGVVGFLSQCAMTSGLGRAWRRARLECAQACYIYGRHM